MDLGVGYGQGGSDYSGISFNGGARVEVGVNQAAESVADRLIKTDKSYKVALAQIATYPGQIKGNTEKIIEHIKEAKEAGAKVVVFPELAIPGYGAMDLLFNRSYVDENIRALEKIRQESHGITVYVGFCDTDPTQKRPDGRPVLFNSAAIIRDGKIIGVQDKTLLPTYDIFDEARYFAKPRRSLVVEVDQINQGATICEDIWIAGYDRDPAKELKHKGAEFVANLSASPFNVGKFEDRAEVVKDTAVRTGLPVIYTNLVGCYDGFEGEIVFDGRSMVVAPNGKTIAFGKAFKEDLVLVDVFSNKELEIPKLSNVEELHDALVLGIREYFHRIGRAHGTELNKAIIGLSGGIDSAVVGALACEALGSCKVLGITMPSKYSSSETKGDAELLAQNLGMKFKTVPIAKEVAACEETLRADPEFKNLPEDVAEENIQARLRMINLMYYANKNRGLVLNTGNKTELALNNCTLYGDMVGGFSVLGDVDKDRVYELAEYINKRAGREVIPLTTITRPPSAELKPGQTDDMVMGAMPQVIAPMVRDIIEEGRSLTETIDLWKETFSPELILSTFRKIDDAEYKRRQSAPSIRVTPRSFGIGRRMPMSHGYEGTHTLEEFMQASKGIVI